MPPEHCYASMWLAGRLIDHEPRDWFGSRPTDRVVNNWQEPVAHNLASFNYPYFSIKIEST